MTDCAIPLRHQRHLLCSLWWPFYSPMAADFAVRVEKGGRLLAWQPAWFENASCRQGLSSRTWPPSGDRWSKERGTGVLGQETEGRGCRCRVCLNCPAVGNELPGSAFVFSEGTLKCDAPRGSWRENSRGAPSWGHAGTAETWKKVPSIPSTAPCVMLSIFSTPRNFLAQFPNSPFARVSLRLPRLRQRA